MSGIKEAAGEALPVLVAKVGTASSTPLASGAIAMAGVDQVLVTFALGDMAAETIDCKVQTVDSDGTSNAADLKAATQLAAHASNNDNKVITITVRQEDLIASGKKHVRGVITTGGATGGVTAIIAHGVGAKYGPCSDGDAAAVVQVKL